MNNLTNPQNSGASPPFSRKGDQSFKGVRGIPTMLLFKDGELKATKVGATTKSNIVSWIKENI